MIQSNRRLSKSSDNYCLSSLLHRSFVTKGCAAFSLTLVVYLNYRFAYNILHDTVYNDGNAVSKSDLELQSLQPFTDKLPTSQSTIQEWEQQTENSMIGLYRYSSVATIQLPTADLEKPHLGPKQTKETNFYQGRGMLNNNDIVVLTRQGHKFNPEDRKRTPNQDRVVVLSRLDDNVYDGNDVNNDWWMGLFDGHGYYGHAVSQYVSSEFARRINKEWEDEHTARSSEAVSSNKNSITIMKDTLSAIFFDINKTIPKFMRTAGSTGISVLKRGDLLYISNVGDSVAFVAAYNKTHNSQSKLKIIYSTKPHKPDTPSERKRIEENGGRVVVSPFPGASARLIIPVKVNSLTYEVGLAMSRSFGDHDGEEVGLTVEPDTDVLDLSQFDKNEEYIVVAATDGLVDFGRLSEEEVALAMVKALSIEGDQTNIRHRLVSMPGIKIARELILKSSEMWDSEPGNYRDDISIVVHKLRL